MSEKEIEVVVSGEMLTLKGEKKEEKEQEEKNFYLFERSYGLFQRSLTCRRALIAIRSRPISKGVLTITMRRRRKRCSSRRPLRRRWPRDAASTIAARASGP